MKKKDTGKDVETCMAELEVIADKLATGEIKIADAMVLYKQGIDLVNQAQKLLNRFEEEIEVIEN